MHLKVPNLRYFLTSAAMLALVLNVTISCSHGNLDRKTAAAKISQKLSSMGPVHNVYVGRIGTHCGYNLQTHYEWSMDPDKDMGILVASKAGYVLVAPDGPGYWKVSLTTRGQSLNPRAYDGMHVVRNGCDYTSMAFPVARPVLVAVTGISGISADDTKANVDFQWKWNLTELARTLREDGSVYPQLKADQVDSLQTLFHQYSPALHLPVPPDAETAPQSDQAIFKRYDDGWRLLER